MSLNDFYRDGYCLVKGLFNPADILAVKKDIDAVFSIYTGATSDDESVCRLFAEDFDGFYGCAQAAQNLISLCRIQLDERMVLALADLGLKFPSINTRPLLSISSHRTAKSELFWKVPAHQDWPSTQGSLNGVTCWMPLVPVDTEMGALQIAKGSHLLGYLEHEEVGVPVLNEEYQFDTVEMEVGDALFFNWLTVHRSGNNTTDRIRWSMHFRFNDLTEPTFINRKYPRHRIDQRKEGILYPNFPTPEQMAELCGKK